MITDPKYLQKIEEIRAAQSLTSAQKKELYKRTVSDADRQRLAEKYAPNPRGTRAQRRAQMKHGDYKP